jgi:hypothetical protein
MHLFQGARADPHTGAVGPDWFDPALIRFADECSATFGRLILYVGTLALLAIGGVHLWDQLPAAMENQPAVAASWAAASRAFPGFAADDQESIDKTSAYEVDRRPYGDRQDILAGAAAGAKPIARRKRGTVPPGDTGAGTAGWLGQPENPGLRGGL